MLEDAAPYVVMNNFGTLRKYNMTLLEKYSTK